jgi:hypothetical protein
VAGGWHSGQRGVRLIPAEGSTSANVYQIISLPEAGKTVTLTYWYRLEGTDSRDDDCFKAGVSVGSQVLAGAEHCVGDGYVTGWTRGTLDLTGKGPGSAFLAFGMSTRSSRSHDNYALVDDVSIWVR